MGLFLAKQYISFYPIKIPILSSQSSENMSIHSEEYAVNDKMLSSLDSSADIPPEIPRPS